MQLGPEPLTVRDDLWICWAKTPDLEKVRCVKVAGQNLHTQGQPTLQPRTQFAFSPFGKHLALVSPLRSLVVDLTRGASWDVSLDPRLAKDFAWLNERTIGYVTCTTSAHRARPHRFWAVQRLAAVAEADGQPADRAGAGRGGVAALSLSYPRAYWAPDGRYVLFLGPGEAGQRQPYLLVLASGEAVPVGQPGEELRTAAWRRDGSAVAWIIYPASRETYFAYLAYTATGEVIDVSQRFLARFGRPPSMLDPLWTPNGQFLVASDPLLGDCLIRPLPWEVRFLGQELQPAVEKILPNEPAPRVNIRNQPATGILIAELGEYEAAIDYRGRILKRLPLGHKSRWTVLPDGSKAVAVEGRLKLAVEPIR